MRLRVLLVVILLCAPLASCVGGDGEASSGRDPSAPAPSPHEPLAVLASDGVPRARMQAGTDSAAGILVRLCRGKDCEAAVGAAPEVLRLREDGMLLFAISEAPGDARVELRRTGADAVVQRGLLSPGGLMAFVPQVARGRYDVRLIAAWEDHRAVWRFALQVPPFGQGG